jgi:hypothetical protein
LTADIHQGHLSAQPGKLYLLLRDVGSIGIEEIEEGMMKKLVTAIISAFFLVTFIGCGGGDSDSSSSTPTDPDQEFSLAGYKDLTVGKEIYNSAIFGSDSEGNTITGYIVISNDQQITLSGFLDGIFDGIVVTPRRISLQLEINNGAVVLQSEERDFYDENGYLILVESMVNVIGGETTLVLCVPAFPYSLPDSVKIGDTETIPTFSCDDGSTQVQTWRIEDARDGKIFFITNASAIDEFGVTMSTTEIKLTINSESEILRFETTTTDLDSGYTVRVNSDAPQ